ncbi:MAG: TonB C-terminal domain-containing protein [Proteobacteria bacterium]|nr:TonB C-terminal domain-containing protein [Pseudomonadota bacterium]MCP4917058.1 TonB C-terminal domain-containing protein [Pseudomonadota bacterium]
MSRSRRKVREAWVARLLTWGAVSLFVHVLFLAVMDPIWPWLNDHPDSDASVPPSLVFLEPMEIEDPENPEPETPEFRGQIVDMPEPTEKEKPDDADYLAEYDQTVPEEMRSEKFRINPEVVSPEFSREDKLEMEDLVDLNIEEKSTGAQVGNDSFDPDRHGRLASLPSPYAVTNKDGLQKPTAASHSTSAIAGAPNNDKLDEAVGNRTLLNTNEYLYAAYMQQIRRLVNFYWQQNLDNLPRTTPLAKSEYVTVVEVTLTSTGALDSIVIAGKSGSDPVDNCVVEAFRIAGPFPPPPEQLVDGEGRARIPDFAFTLNIGQAKAQYEGIDPRSGVQFPGILKAPR